MIRRMASGQMKRWLCLDIVEVELEFREQQKNVTIRQLYVVAGRVPWSLCSEVVFL